MAQQFLEWLPRRLLDCMADTVFVTDAQLDPFGPVIVYANPAWERVTGWRASEVVGEPLGVAGTSHGDGTERISLDRLRRCLDDGCGFEGEIEDWVDGTAGRTAWRVDPITDSGGEIAGFGFLQRRAPLGSRSEPADAFNVILELRHLLDHEQLELTRDRERVAQTAMHLSGAEGAVVEEHQDGEMVYRAVAGVSEGLEGMRLPIEGSLSGYCYAASEVLLVADTQTDLRTQFGSQASDMGFRSGVLAPLLQGDQRFGVLKVFSSTCNAFAESDRDFVEILAGLLAAVLYRARAYELEAERRHHLVDALPILVAFVDANRRYREVNAAYADWFGWPIGEVLGKPVWEIIGPSAYENVRPYMDRVLQQGEAVSYEEAVRFPNAGETVISVDYSPSLRTDGSVAGFYALVRDVTKSRAADVDFLTGLPNRRRFDEEAERQIEVNRRHGRHLSLVFADIDHLKWWNDAFGHQTGDRIIKEVAGFLQEQARASDLVARWGGEEFVILAPETDLDGAVALAERIRGQIASQCQPEGDGITLSFGVAEAQGDEPSLRNLTRAADEALYIAKNAGRNRVHRSQ